MKHVLSFLKSTNYDHKVNRLEKISNLMTSLTVGMWAVLVWHIEPSG